MAPAHIQRLVDCLLAGTSPPADDLAVWARYDLTRYDVLTRLTGEWVELLGPAAVGDSLLPAVLEQVVASPDPDAALLALSRLQEERGGPTLALQLAEDPRFAHDLLFMLGLGHVPCQALLREPGLADLLLDGEALAQPIAPAALAQGALRVVQRLRQPENRRNALRRWKREQFLRLLAQDFLLAWPQREVTAAISAVADACAQAALAAAVTDVLGPGRAPNAGLAVIAMGKWGSLELNYNSDIDLLCVSDRARADVSAPEWEAVVQALGRELSEETDEGRVFRVDFRLRPEGGRGSLVPSLDSCCSYYEHHGEAWETLALTRARCCAGDFELGRRFEELAAKIAYGTRVRHAGIESIRGNRRRLDARADAERNVKEGRGGIRDVEFTAELLQLVRGVTDPTVRCRNTWDALDALTRAGALSETERRNLAEAYDFLRRVEHLLQIQPAAPTKELPIARDRLRRLARAMGYRDSGPLSAGDRFLAQYRSHTATTRDLSETLFFNPIPLTSPDADHESQQLLDPLAADDEALAHLAMIPFAEPGEARRRLLYLAHGEPPMRLEPEIQGLFVEFLPALLACVQRMPDPDASLRWFGRFVASAGGRALAYRFFIDHPPVLELLCRLGGFSEYLSRILVDHPEFLDRVVLASYASRDPSLVDLRDELRHRTGPLRQAELRLDDVRRFRRREAFRIGVRDLLGFNDVEAVTGQLTDLAEACTAQLLDEARALVPGAAELPFAVIGCGKLGGRELHYNSDLDVLFIFDDQGQADAARRAERLAQTASREAAQLTRAGRLYALDARLRPFGGSSPLARSLESYAAYLAEHAEPWERLALTRARFVAGDAELGARFEALAAQFAYGSPLATDDLETLRHIKRRIETERLDTDDTAHLDLKLEPGGILDIEYLVQTLLVMHGRERPALRLTNTPAALRALGAAGVFPRTDAELLLRNWQWFRRTELRLQLIHERPSGLLPLDPAGLAASARRLGYSWREASDRPDQLLADLRLRLGAVREVISAHLGLRPA